MSAQTDFFITDETDLLRLEIEDLKAKQENMRRGLFARHGELVKLVLSQQFEIERLKERALL